MGKLEDLTRIITIDIALYGKLRESLMSEVSVAKSDNVEIAADQADRREAIERSIDRTNGQLFELMSWYKTVEHNLDENERDLVSTLVAELKDVVSDTMNMLEVTMDTIRDSRRRIAGIIRELDSNKSAVNAYERLNASIY